jgi:hypothetical protein
MSVVDSSASRLERESKKMKNVPRIVIQLGSAVVASALLCSSLSAMTSFDFQVVELAGVPLLSATVVSSLRSLCCSRKALGLNNTRSLSIRAQSNRLRML